MVTIEAAAHSLPTVAFATGGIVDAVAEGQSGHLVTPGDYLSLAQAALQVLADDSNAWPTRASAFAAQFAWRVMGEKLWDILQTDIS